MHSLKNPATILIISIEINQLIVTKIIAMGVCFFTCSHNCKWIDPVDQLVASQLSTKNLWSVEHFEI